VHSPAPVAGEAPIGAAQARAVRGAGIAAIAMATPSRVVENASITERLGLRDDWIESRTGILERRHAGPDELLSDLAANAGGQALRKAGIAPADVDTVIVATTTPDDILPNAAPLVAHALGIPSAGAFDLGAACTGFVSALDTAAALVESGRSETTLVVGADLMSRVVDQDDRDTSVLFGDGAGAAVVTAAAGHGRIGPSALGGDGSAAALVCIPRAAGVMRMSGQDTFRRAVACLSEASLEAAALSGLGLADIDLFVYHQANGRILRAVGERLGLEQDRVVDCIGHYGNTSAATVPIALCEAGNDGRLFPGARVLVGAFGAGLTWGALVVEWGDA
jgi:3-oxoacyl-[acyl-carrier-protein] synthase III